MTICWQCSRYRDWDLGWGELIRGLLVERADSCGVTRAGVEPPSLELVSGQLIQIDRKGLGVRTVDQSVRTFGAARDLQVIEGIAAVIGQERLVGNTGEATTPRGD